MAETDPPREIIIVKRRANMGDEDHHGGVWKIAFADFMTAMMAFFLVLWIVNSTSKETQAAIARHFNPLKISDTVPAPRGLKDPRDSDFNALLSEVTKEAPKKLECGALFISGANVSTTDSASDSGANNSTLCNNSHQSVPKSASNTADFDADKQLFEQPEQTLKKIIDEHQKLVDAADRYVLLEPANPHSKPNSFHDPFAQNRTDIHENWQDQAAYLSNGSATGTELANTSITVEGEGHNLHSATLIQKLNDQFLSLADRKRPAVSVTEVNEGVLISLSDTETFSMFNVGSPTPNARTILAIERIAEVVNRTSGLIIVRGHTDGRTFRGTSSNNWRLSSSRAQVVYFILRRAGIPEERFAHLEGHANKSLARPEDPLSALNRRIEIILRPEK